MWNAPTDETQPYQIRRDKHPTVTLYWIAESIEYGRPVKLYGLNCLFCGRLIAPDFRGHITMVVNAPVSLAGFGMAMGVTCRYCKQHYRIVVSDSFIG